VDVFSPSEDSPGAFVCCSRSERIDSALCTPPVRQPTNSRLMVSDDPCLQHLTLQQFLLCLDDSPPPTQPSYLPFARRLARFPDAWLLPLFPFFIRGAVHAFRILRGHAAGSPTQITTAMRRLYLYIGLIQVRGWVLYLVFDQLEEFLVPAAGSDCWYHHLLPIGHAICQGRVSDFSDHVVLYFAQITPMALIEVLHSLAIPYWNSADGPDKSGNRLMPTLLIVGMLYLYFIAFLGAYKTAAYFHTGSEIFRGYLVSLIVQVPLFVLQCTRTWPKARKFFFGFAN
jgi:hypothetical protein